MEHHTIERYDERGMPVFKVKRKFDTHAQAIAEANYINAYGHFIHKLVAYKCDVCFKYHIGKDNTVLTDEDRIKYQEKARKLQI